TLRQGTETPLAQLSGQRKPVNLKRLQRLLYPLAIKSSLLKILADSQQSVPAFNGGTQEYLDVTGIVEKVVLFQPVEIRACVQLGAELFLQLAVDFLAGMIATRQPVHGGAPDLCRID